jgi:hypothetical protein
MLRLLTCGYGDWSAAAAAFHRKRESKYQALIIWVERGVPLMSRWRCGFSS